MPKSFHKIILFRLAGEYWAMPLSEDSQFVSYDKIVALPIDNKNVAGLIYNAGRIITVLNTDKILNIKSHNQKSKLCLIFYSHGDFYALTVDEGGETMEIPRVLTDKNKKSFNKYIKIDDTKVYILESEEIWKNAKI